MTEGVLVGDRSEAQPVAARGHSDRDTALAIRTRDLRKVFRRGRLSTVAVDGVDLRIPSETIFGLIGPNGAGKSTLVSMLATIMRPTSGDAWVLGHHVVHEAREARLCLSLNAFAGERGFYWRLNGWQNLEFFAALQGLDARTARRRVAASLERVGLDPRSRLRFGEFSSGMKRRLNIARALLVDRPIYLFDEPTTGIDPHSAATVRSILRELKLAGKTIVLVTHDMEEVTELCDEVGMLYRGRLIRQDSPDVLRRLVATTEIEIQVGDPGATDFVEARLRHLPVVTETEVRGDGRIRLRTPAPESDIQALLAFAANGQLPIVGVAVVRPDLRDAFIRLVEDATGATIDPQTTVDWWGRCAPPRRLPRWQWHP